MTEGTSEIVMSGQPTYGNGTYSQLASSARNNDDLADRIGQYVDHNVTDTPPIRTGRIGGGFANNDTQPAQPPRREERSRYSRDNNHYNNPREKKSESTKTSIDPNGTFFVTEGKSRGGIRMDWTRWYYVEHPMTNQITGVNLIYKGLEDHVELVGKDAYNFLRIVGDRTADVFSRPVVN